MVEILKDSANGSPRDVEGEYHLGYYTQTCDQNPSRIAAMSRAYGNQNRNDIGNPEGHSYLPKRLSSKWTNWTKNQGKIGPYINFEDCLMQGIRRNSASDLINEKPPEIHGEIEGQLRSRKKSHDVDNDTGAPMLRNKHGSRRSAHKIRKPDVIDKTKHGKHKRRDNDPTNHKSPEIIAEKLILNKLKALAPPDDVKENAQVTQVCGSESTARATPDTDSLEKLDKYLAIESELSRLRRERQLAQNNNHANAQQNAEKCLVKQLSTPEMMKSEHSPDNSDAATMQDASKYLRPESSPFRAGRRSVSDLGFQKKLPGSGTGLIRSNSRTLALLQNPVLRKSLARTMKINAEEDNFDEEVYEKLSIKTEESFDQSFSLTGSVRMSQSRRLCYSTSDIGSLGYYDNNSRIHSSTEELSITSSQSEMKDNASDSNSQSEKTNKSHDLISQSKSPKTSCNSAINRASLSSSKTFSSFKIPSFDEFKSARGKSRFMSQSTANLEKYVPTIIEEDSNTNTDTGGSSSSFATYKAPHPTRFALINTTEESSVDEVFTKPSEDPPKPKPRRKKRKQHRRAELPGATLTKQTHRSQSMTTFSTLHDIDNDTGTNTIMCNDDFVDKSDIMQKLHSDKNSSLKGSVKSEELEHPGSIKHSQSESILKLAKQRSGSILSDYVSDSNGELSDNLEDVFLQPAKQYNNGAVCSISDVKMSLNGRVSTLHRDEQLSDSGCLIERQSMELDGARFPQLGEQRSMLRSTSDVSEMFAEQERNKQSRDRRSKQFRSDPLNAGDCKGQTNGLFMRRQDSREHILEFLDKKSLDSLESSTSRDSPDNSGYSSEVSSCFDVDDPAEKVPSLSSTEHIMLCSDCNELLLLTPDVSDHVTLCLSCIPRCRQRKEAILEIIETEENYGKDLTIIHDHFFKPMQDTGFLNPDQMRTIFINLQELISVNKFFSTQLRNSLDQAEQNLDQYLQLINIGQLFLDSSNMLLAYESYCINQSAAPILLDQLLEEKNLLRIFLEVTQREKAVLRKMDLKAFLMIPVQRIMKYPLLLSRLHKVTLTSHPDYKNIMQAQRKLENILELINSKTSRPRRRLSFRRSQEFDACHFENIEMHKLAMEMLGWDRSNLHFLRMGRLSCTAIVDDLSLKRNRSQKFIALHGLLVTLGKPTKPESKTVCDSSNPLQMAVLVLIKEKNSKLQAFRDPLLLKQCIVSQAPDDAEVFELHEANKDSFLFKCESEGDTTEWLMEIRALVAQLSQWKNRRNALANIMLQDF